MGLLEKGRKRKKNEKEVEDEEYENEKKPWPIGNREKLSSK